jgi:D-amino-acid dehydrogenase
MHVVVIGAGVVGSCTALALAERGLDVTLVDRHAVAAAETSHANGGCLTPGHAEPWNSPGIAQRLLRHAGPGEPFRIFAHALPGLIGWGWQFLWQSKATRYYRNARDNTRLAVYSGQCLAELRQRHAFDYHAWTDGSLELFFNSAELEHAADLRRQIGDSGVVIEPIDVDQIISLEPALAPVADRLVGGLLMPKHESGDACEFSAEMARLAAELGANLRFDSEVRRILADRGGVVGVELAAEVIDADAVVLSAGVASPALARPLGVKLPIQPVKGYSLTLELEQPELAPRMPLLDLEQRIVAARYGNRLRLAGLADFDGYRREVRPERLKRLIDSACTLLPRLSEEIRSDRPEAWAGLRPMTPKGPPMLGSTPVSGLYLNTGHGSMGWTQAAGSATILADLLTGREPQIEMTGLVYRG